jgi:hypothetical protein
VIKLEIFVGTSHCLAGDLTADIVRRLQCLALHELELCVVDLSEPGVERPASVFAVPTYVLDGRIVSLGTPVFDELVGTIGALMRSRDGPGETL